MRKKNEFMLQNYLVLFFTISFLFSGFLPELKAQTLRNCSEIHFYNPSAPSGVYKIDPDGSGPMSAMDCQCDMTTDGGGWTLVLNYNHLENTNPSLKVFNDSMPLQGHASLGFDESGTIYWGHSGTTILTGLPFDEVRFYGITSGHNREINFKTSHTRTISYFKTGVGSTEGIKTDFTPLAGHTANLPAAIDMTVTNMGDYAMTAYPLWTGSTYHWYLGGVDPVCINRWEVDDYPCNTPSTFHQIWVRQNAYLGIGNEQKSKIEIQISPNPMNDVTELTLPNISHQSFNSLKLKFFNMIGEQVFPEIIQNTESFTIKSGVLSPGIYLCRLLNENGILGSVKIVIN